MKTIDNWSVHSSPYSAPELRHVSIFGVFRDAPGVDVAVGPLVSVKKCVVTTRDGTTFALGKIDPDYLKWMHAEGIHYNPANPIRIV